jgi:hypothetical protein
VHVVGTLPRLRQRLGEVDVLDGAGVERALGAEQGRHLATAGQRLLLGLGEDVHHSGATAVRLGTAEAQHVDVLAGDRPDHVGAGHEDPALRPEHHHVGERRAVRRPARRRAEDDRDLRDLAGGLGHRVEDLPDRVQRPDALRQPGAARVPEAHDRQAVGERPLVGAHHHLAADLAHRPAHDGGVGAERDDGGAVDSPGRGEHAAVVVLADEAQRPVVEERSQPVVRVARVLLPGELDAGRGGWSGGRCGHGFSWEYGV